MRSSVGDLEVKVFKFGLRSDSEFNNERFEENGADFLTKGLKGDTFCAHRDRAGIRDFGEVCEVQELRAVQVQRSAGRKLLMNLFALQVYKAEASSLDVDFMIHCWLLGFGLTTVVVFAMWLILKIMWATHVRRPISTIRLWGKFVQQFTLEPQVAGKRIHLTEYGHAFRTARSCHYVTDASDRFQLKSGVKM